MIALILIVIQVRHILIMSGPGLNGGASIQEDVMITSVKSSQYAYTWAIRNFSTWLMTVEGTQSSFQFPHNQESDEKWILEFRPKASDDPEQCSIYLKLIFETKKQEKFEVDYEITMQNSSGSILQSATHKSNFGKIKTWGYEKFVDRKRLLEYTKHDDQLIIKCKITTNSKILSEKGSPKKLLKHSPGRLSNEMKSLVEGNKFGDVTILVGDQRFLAYKGILSARSTVFAAMFEHAMQETIESCVTIDDIEPGIFKKLLRYIYTDLTPAKLNTTALKLYTAADKYDIPTLKDLCRVHIMNKLRWENATETLILADTHSDLEMKNKALRFLSGSEAAKVTKTESWSKLVLNHPHLVTELVEALTAKSSVSEK